MQVVSGPIGRERVENRGQLQPNVSKVSITGSGTPRGPLPTYGYRCRWISSCNSNPLSCTSFRSRESGQEPMPESISKLSPRPGSTPGDSRGLDSWQKATSCQEVGTKVARHQPVS
jgi:hypothetical protein